MSTLNITPSCSEQSDENSEITAIVEANDEAKTLTTFESNLKKTGQKVYFTTDVYFSVEGCYLN